PHAQRLQRLRRRLPQRHLPQPRTGRGRRAGRGGRAADRQVQAGVLRRRPARRHHRGRVGNGSRVGIAMTPDGREAATLPGGGAGPRERVVPAQARADRAMSIGEVMALLKPEFPDITVSKIRFLEGAGLVHPRRSASGYRKFSEDDVATLRFVLRAQRDQYLPLRVIRERLADLEAAGRQPPPPAERPPERPAEREEFGLVVARGTGERGSWYDGEDLVVLRLARDLADYGLEARHLRMYKIFAEREAALFEQVVSPLVRQRNPEARTRARETLEALAELGSRMRDAALRAAVSNFAEATTEPHR